ncbi:hypothetical protein [uncultured Croceitalea sp.]|uniref:hypothetical protein n=1 Tax=uncultured Croceitalea sp. TaxID=1798908 RepID=UPI003305C768
MDSIRNMKILKTLITLVILSSSYLNAQEIVMDYYPEFEGNVSQKNYDVGKSMLKGEYEELKEAKDVEPYWVDYYNIAIAYNKMGVDAVTVFEFLKKAKSLNSKNVCTMIASEIESVKGDITKLGFHQRLGDLFLNLTTDCDLNIKPFTLEFLKENKRKQNLEGLNEALIDKLILLQEMDLRYRYSSKVYYENVEKQNLLDEQVAVELSKILDKYGYPGKDIVGEYYQNLACLLLEHSRPTDWEYKEKYLPLVLEAYRKKQMNKGFLYMLLDRIHTLKNGKQIFGSHAGKPYYDEVTLTKLKDKYGL